MSSMTRPASEMTRAERSDSCWAEREENSFGKDGRA